jgi:small subunit ribosomal protein S14
MAKKSVINRNRKRAATAARFAARRTELKKQMRDIAMAKPENRAAANRTAAQRESLMRALQRMPRDSSATRYRSRCALTGRGRGVFRLFGLGRNKLREMAMNGEIPGIVKASW